MVCIYISKFTMPNLSNCIDNENHVRGSDGVVVKLLAY